MYKKTAEKHNIEYCGAVPFESLKERISGKKLRRLYELVPHPETVIFFLFPYFVSNAPGNISKYARGLDYHSVLGGILNEMAAELKKDYPKNVFAPFTDSSPIPEVYGAAAAGLGVVGENRLLINEKYGSFCFIGEIVTDLKVESGFTRPEKCDGCGICKSACPTKALSHDGVCMSYLTQKKGEFSDFEEKLIKEHPYIWGCDICQDVCPKNKNARPTQISQFRENLIENLDLEILEKIKGGKRSFLWRGAEILARNLKIKE